MRCSKLIPVVLAAGLLSIAVTGCQIISQRVLDISSDAVSVDQAGEDPDEGSVVELIRVVDGDTIAVAPTAELPATNDAGTEHAVRLLGIDAPEMNKMSDEEPQCGAQDASDQLAHLLSGATTVIISFDAKSDHTDRYGRSLAYVHAPEGVDIALEMVREGYVEAWYPSGEPEPALFPAYAAAQVEAKSVGAGAFAYCSEVGR